MTHNPCTSTGAAVSTQPAAPVEHQLTDQSKGHAMQHDVIDAEIISIDGTPYQEGPAMSDTGHTAPELVAADVAILAVAAAVRDAHSALAAAQKAIIEMEIVLAEYHSRDGQCVCGCS